MINLFHGHKLTEVVMALSEVKLRSLKARDKAYQESDGGGMFVEVSPSGGKVWRLRYRLFGKQEKVSLV